MDAHLSRAGGVRLVGQAAVVRSSDPLRAARPRLLRQADEWAIGDSSLPTAPFSNQAVAFGAGSEFASGTDELLGESGSSGADSGAVPAAFNDPGASFEGGSCCVGAQQALRSAELALVLADARFRVAAAEWERVRKKAEQCIDFIIDEVACADAILQLPGRHAEFVQARDARERAQDEFNKAQEREHDCCTSPTDDEAGDARP
jgi:hypothetical protein